MGTRRHQLWQSACSLYTLYQVYFNLYGTLLNFPLQVWLPARHFLSRYPSRCCSCWLDLFHLCWWSLKPLLGRSQCRQSFQREKSHHLSNKITQEHLQNAHNVEFLCLPSQEPSAVFWWWTGESGRPPSFLTFTTDCLARSLWNQLPLVQKLPSQRTFFYFPLYSPQHKAPPATLHRPESLIRFQRHTENYLSNGEKEKKKQKCVLRSDAWALPAPCFASLLRTPSLACRPTKRHLTSRPGECSSCDTSPDSRITVAFISTSKAQCSL